MAGLNAIKRSAGRYSLTKETRKWFLSSSEKNVADFVDFLGVQWSWLDHLEEYVRSDRPLDIHQTMSEEEWDAYQRGMRAAANFLAPEVAKRMPMPAGAKSMLDIGGSHGFYSVLLCRRYAQLQAVVLDLPDAVAAAAPILAREDMGDRVVHRAGDALQDELGDCEHDVVLISDLAHHFDDANNRALVQKCAKALTPGGLLIIKDTVRSEDTAIPRQMPQLGALGVSMISDSTMWTVPQMVSWLDDAGLKEQKTIWLRGAPGVGMIVGQRAR
jgi:SAM-dependent methyltransferase